MVNGNLIRVAGFNAFSATTTSSLLLDSNNAAHKIRFVPNTNFNGTATIKYRAWDQTTGVVGNTVNTTTTGTTTPFSTGEVTKTITVNPINDEPTQTLQLVADRNEDVGSVTIAGFATTTKGGGSDENSQTLSFSLTNDNPGLFAVAPAIASMAL